MKAERDAMLPYHCYGLDDFRCEYDALARVDTDGVWYRREDVDALIVALTGKIAEAYGYLWHVNNSGEGFQFPPERAAHMARRVLRDTMTPEQRGDAINKAATELFKIVENRDDEPY